MTNHITPVVTGLAFAEAPRWRADPAMPGGGELWFSDFFTRRVMRIDGCFMTSERDEFFYHEPMVHLPAVAHAGPASALVVGGGDSALEAAIALSEQPDTDVTLSYRSAAFSRVKPKNRSALERQEQAGRLRVLLNSQVLSIAERPGFNVAAVEAWQSLAIVAVVCAVTMWQGFALGVASGDRALLVGAGYAVETTRDRRTFVEAVVSRFEEAHRRVGHHGH